MALGFSALMQQPLLAGIIGLAGGGLMLFMGLSLLWASIPAAAQDGASPGMAERLVTITGTDSQQYKVRLGGREAEGKGRGAGLG